MSYNLTSFSNNEDRANSPGVLYVIVLVNKKTYERECVKIGITKGNTWKDAVKRSNGFKGYEIRIQKIIQGTLLEVYTLEQKLHEKYKEFRFKPNTKFGGHTECFDIAVLKDVLNELRSASD